MARMDVRGAMEGERTPARSYAMKLKKSTKGDIAVGL